MSSAYLDIVELYSQGRYQDAFDAAENALKQQPGDFNLLNAAATNANACGMPEQAERYWKIAAAVNPDIAVTFYNLGVLFYGSNRLEEAEAHFRQSLALNNTHVGTYINLGTLLQQSGRYEEAEICFRNIVAIDPDDCRGWFNLGHVLNALGHNDDAVIAYKMTIEKNPEHADACVNLGVLLQQLRRFAEAEHFYLKALTIRKDSADTYRNLGLMYQEQKQFADAEICFRNAMIVNPDFKEAEWSLGMLMLRLGKYVEGWQHYEARYHPNIKGQTIFPPANPYPQWQGEPLAGKSIAVWSEQGMGDDIQFCRFLPVLKALGAAHVTFVVKPLLAHLMQTASGIDRLVIRGSNEDMSQHDYWTLLHSIPCHAKIGLESLPTRTPYLFAKPPYLEQTEKMLNAIPGFKVGVCWKGSPRFVLDAERSPGIEPFKRLFNIAGARFVTVVPGGRDELIPNAGQAAFDLGRDVGDSTPPFEETAALISSVDLMISSDTAIAHLAGALGTPTWVVLPYSACWRWLEQRDDSPWYPNIRLFRQAERGDWAEVFERVAAELATLIAARQ
jgi:tetratricopeptide (TPR) repeat protein